MRSIAYRVLRAPLRSLTFALLGLIALINASTTVGRALGDQVGGVLPLAVLGAISACLAYGGWFARKHPLRDTPLQHRIGASHLGFVAIGVIAVLAAFSGPGGLPCAIALVLVSLSLWRVRDDDPFVEPCEGTHKLLSDSDIARIAH